MLGSLAPAWQHDAVHGPLCEPLWCPARGRWGPATVTDFTRRIGVDTSVWTHLAFRISFFSLVSAFSFSCHSHLVLIVVVRCGQVDDTPTGMCDVSGLLETMDTTVLQVGPSLSSLLALSSLSKLSPLTSLVFSRSSLLGHLVSPLLSPLSPLRCAPRRTDRATASPPSCSGARSSSCPAGEIHRVGPEFASWSRNLTENPYQSLKLGPNCGQTL